MNIEFKGKRVIVTGAGRGIGRAVAAKLAILGADVVAVSKSKANLETLKAEYPKIRTIELDLVDWKETQAKLKDIAPQVDLLVNNAAASDCQPIGIIKEESIDTMFAVNYKASLNLIQLVASGMKLRKKGAIVNVSSVSGMCALDGHCVYGSTKSAMDMLTKIAAKELGPYNIRVNSINPTVVMTDMGKKFWSNEDDSNRMKAKIPMGRFVEVDEVVYPILFLLSDYAGMINGVQLPVDGGFTAS